MKYPAWHRTANADRRRLVLFFLEAAATAHQVQNEEHSGDADDDDLLHGHTLTPFQRTLDPLFRSEDVRELNDGRA